MKPAVSVIIPTYNMASYLPSAVQSIVSQTQRDLELIIVDDGSTDNTFEVVKRLKEEVSRSDLNIKYLTTTNRGRSLALNYGMKFVSSPMLTFLDADDSLPSDSLELRCQHLKEHLNLDGIFAAANVLDLNGRLQFVCGIVPEEVSRLDDLILDRPSVPIHVNTMMVRTEKVRNIGGFDPQYLRAEDLDFAIRVSQQLQMGFLDQVVYNYTIDSHNWQSRVRNRVIATCSKAKLTDLHSSKLDLPDRLTRVGKRVFWETLKLGMDLVTNRKNLPFSSLFSQVIYVRDALGKDGEHVRIYKLRTMVSNADKKRDALIEQSGLDPLGKISDDPRITPIGRVLRKYWIDEIPQLYNLIRGDLDLVGVRPRSEQLWADLPPEHKDKALRYKPGLVGVQYAFSSSCFSEMLNRELDYLEQKECYGYLADVKFLALVVYNVLFHGCRSS
ncbi:hypothetical protein COY27_00340 [Candidatus Woesearchaeota archaeon CG_4_10_14_0_2_um_filter_33_13]|nr:MAG: hypothetical protein COY27_00340 [Candidatus Woesearchaeota archaeon CG_4_10_14_0_2_um_filter_33_13]